MFKQKSQKDYTHKKETGTQKNSQYHKHLRKCVCVWKWFQKKKKCCIDQWNNEIDKLQRMETKNTKPCTKTLTNQCNKKKNNDLSFQLKMGKKNIYQTKT